MYPSGPLIQLGVRKARLQSRIAGRRQECVAIGGRLAVPLEKIDTWQGRLRRVGPYVPFGFAFLGLWRRLGARPAAKEPAAGGWLRWLPLVVQGLRLFQKL